MVNPSPAPALPPLRLVSYNIRKCLGLDMRRRPERTLEVIAETHADIVVLQEDIRFGERERSSQTARPSQKEASLERQSGRGRRSQ